MAEKGSWLSRHKFWDKPKDAHVIWGERKKKIKVHGETESLGLPPPNEKIGKGLIVTFPETSTPQSEAVVRESVVVYQAPRGKS